MESIIEKIKKLPPEKKEQAIDFIDYLGSKENLTPKKKPKLDWFGGLKEFRAKYTSVELEKKSVEWRM